jgi:uncharacterized protein YcfL
MTNSLYTPAVLRRSAFVVCTGLLALLPALGGCDTTRPPAAGLPDPVAGNLYPKITLDGNLQQFMAIDYTRVVVTQPTADTAIAVQVPARSQADNDMNIQFQYTWLDAAGRQVGLSGWRTVTLPNRRQQMLAANALTREAVDWQLDIRVAR